MFWHRTYEGIGLSKGRNVTRLSDGRLAAVGYRLGSNNRSDAWVLLCTAEGDTVWTRNFGDDFTDIGNAIVQKPNGNLYVGGIYQQSNSQSDMWGFEIDLNGNQVGTPRFFGQVADEYCYAIAYDDDQNVRLLGRTGPDTNLDSYVAVIPTQGTPFTRLYSTNGWSEQFKDGLPWFGGMLYVGRAGSNGTTTSFYMRATDENELSLWSWRYGATGTDGGFFGVAAVPSGGAVAVGDEVVAEGVTRGYLLGVAPPGGVQGVVRGLTNSQPISGARVHEVGSDRIATTNSAGEYRLDLSAGLHDLVVESECIESDTIFGIMVVENELAPVDFFPGQPLLTNVSSSLNIVAMNDLQGGTVFPVINGGSGLLHYSLDLTPLAPAGATIEANPASGDVPPGETVDVVISVFAETPNDGVYEFFGSLTIHSNSCPDTVLTMPVLVTVLDAETRPGLPSSFALSSAYPNPFNGQTSVDLELPSETDVSLDVFNVQGRRIQTVAAGRLSAGNHRINIRLEEQATGVYVLRVTTPEEAAVQKLFYLK
ncbi:MAG: T9SS type A sorting domain-containing protein [bacterium]|nr:T9SS type A sorting domain-containing protein [bacterium]